MKHVIYILLALSLISCDITKQASKNKTDTDYKEQYEQREYRQGDMATFKPELNIKYKDTTILRTTVQGTILKTTYDKQGNVSNIDCISSAIELVTTLTKQLNQQSKEKESTKTESFDPTPFIWAMCGLGFVLLLVLAVLAWIVYKIKKTIT